MATTTVRPGEAFYAALTLEVDGDLYDVSTWKLHPLLRIKTDDELKTVHVTLLKIHPKLGIFAIAASPHDTINWPEGEATFTVEAWTPRGSFLVAEPKTFYISKELS